MMKSAWLLLVAGALAGAAPNPPATCAMAVAFNHPDDNGGLTTAVWRDRANKALLFGDALHVNTDGTKRSYKVTDFWGKTDALNNLCNAMSDACAGLNSAQLQARRMAVEKARADGWPAAAWAASRISSQIIPLHKNAQGRQVPCPEVDGFMVSATALTDPAITDQCKLSRYIDALTVNAVVIPGSAAMAATGAKVGDLAVVMKPDGTTFYAVVGDSGPKKEIGEISIALAGAMLKKTRPPANYDEIRGKSPHWVGKGWDVPKGFVLILPGTRDVANPYITTARIESAAAPLFESWGGAERLKACASVYRRS